MAEGFAVNTRVPARNHAVVPWKRSGFSWLRPVPPSLSCPCLFTAQNGTETEELLAMTTTDNITDQEQNSSNAVTEPAASILAIDIGGSKVKILATGQIEPRKVRAGKRLTPIRMVEAVRELAYGWDYWVL
jgi:hypothetical protein